MAEAEGDILTLDEVAAYLKAGKRTIYRLAASGEMPAASESGKRPGTGLSGAAASVAARPEPAPVLGKTGKKNQPRVVGFFRLK